MITWRPRGARESRKPDNSGTVTVGELDEPGRESAELLETGRASFDYVAVAVDDLVEGGWSAAEGPGSSAAGRLVAALGDRADDAPAPQQAAINDRSARDRTRTRGPPRTGSAGRWSAAPDGRTACRSGSSSRRFVPPEDGAGARATPPCPESQSTLPTAPRPVQCEQQAAASRLLVSAFFSPVLAPAQNRWPASGRQGNWTEHDIPAR